MKKIIVLIIIVAVVYVYISNKESNEIPPPSITNAPLPFQQSTTKKQIVTQPRASQLPKILNLAQQNQLQVLNYSESEAGNLRVTYLSVSANERSYINNFMDVLTRSMNLKDIDAGNLSAHRDQNNRRTYSAELTIKY